MSSPSRPFKVGDLVRVIAGPHSGHVSRVQIAWGSSICLEIDGALVWMAATLVEESEANPLKGG